MNGSRPTRGVSGDAAGERNLGLRSDSAFGNASSEPADVTGLSELLDDASGLAQDILTLVHDQLLVSYRFMNRPLAAVPVRTRMDIRTCATDARQLVFSPGFVLKSFDGGSPLLARAYLHMVLHCLLRHPFPPEGADMLRWSTACDAAVCALIQQLDDPAIQVVDEERDVALAWAVGLVRGAAQQGRVPAAAQLYAAFERQGLSNDELMRLDLLFGLDTHELWLPSDAQGDAVEPDDDSRIQLEQQWREIARQTEIDLESQSEGAERSSLAVALGQIEAQPMGLEELLRQFAAPSEAIEVNPDEFDYIYYTYGLSRYGNIPLIEPLEYRESSHVRDFVVALDTSGSIDRELATLFVQRACGMLLADSALGEESRVRIVQADALVQDECLVARREEVQEYLDGFQLKGRGGTDFRCVFDHVDDLIDSGDITDMGGLVYFTDGLGEFPASAPTYDVAFVFVDELGPYPAWATGVLAYSQELKG